MLIWKLMVAVHVFLYRVTGGRFGSSMRGFNVLLLTTLGRKTAQKRTSPLGYIKDGDAYVIIASNAGLDKHPAWYHNIRSNPQVEIQVRDKTLSVKAETATGDYRKRLWEQLLREAPAYGDYEKQTEREIPLVVLRA
jgi:F420H(2)-dependent quinone reductase